MTDEKKMIWNATVDGTKLDSNNYCEEIKGYESLEDLCKAIREEINSSYDSEEIVDAYHDSVYIDTTGDCIPLSEILQCNSSSSVPSEVAREALDAVMEEVEGEINSEYDGDEPAEGELTVFDGGSCPLSCSGITIAWSRHPLALSEEESLAEQESTLLTEITSLEDKSKELICKIATMQSELMETNTELMNNLTLLRDVQDKRRALKDKQGGGPSPCTQCKSSPLCMHADDTRGYCPQQVFDEGDADNKTEDNKEE